MTDVVFTTFAIRFFKFLPAFLLSSEVPPGFLASKFLLFFDQRSEGQLREQLRQGQSG